MLLLYFLFITNFFLLFLGIPYDDDLPDGVCFRRPQVVQSSSSSCSSNCSEKDPTYETATLGHPKRHKCVAAAITCPAHFDPVILPPIEFDTPRRGLTESTITPAPKASRSSTLFHRVSFLPFKLKSSLFRAGTSLASERNKGRLKGQTLNAAIPSPDCSLLFTKRQNAARTSPKENIEMEIITSEISGCPAHLPPPLTRCVEDSGSPVMVPSTYSLPLPLPPPPNEGQNDQENYQTLACNTFFTDPPKSLCSAPLSVMTMLWVRPSMFSTL